MLGSKLLGQMRMHDNLLSFRRAGMSRHDQQSS
jgi:hypothetical protein